MLPISRRFPTPTTITDWSTCLLEAESGNRHLHRLEISLLPNGNRVEVEGIPLKSAFMLQQVLIFLSLKHLQAVQALQRM